ncbi:MAG: hypothetical protein Rhirs2KO_11320 [Rhizobiaceae bacterium]
MVDVAPTPLFHDPWLEPRGQGIQAIADAVAARLEAHLQTTARKPRTDIVSRRRTVVENLVCNLAVLVLSPEYEPQKRLAIDTARIKATRYDRSDFPQRPLGEVLRALEDCGFIHRTPYVFKQARTQVEPSAALWEELVQRASLAEVGRVQGAETIYLAARKEEGDGPRRRFADERLPKVLLHYEETDVSIALREQMETINAHLNRHVIALGNCVQPPVHLVRWFLLRSGKDPVSFNLMGRLAQGWWMQLEKTQRHRITIDGETLVDLDWQAMWAYLLYLRAGLQLPERDPYGIPGLEQHRAGAKLGFLTMVARTGPLRRLSPKLKQALPGGWDSKRFVSAVHARHPLLAPYFGQDLAVELMATESRVLVRLLLDLADKGIPFLPVHDGGMCRASHKNTVRQAMESATMRELGVVLPVIEKPIYRPAIEAA